MKITADQKQISSDERLQIVKQVHADLVEHLYEGCLPGTISGLIVSGALFLNYYGYSPTHLLIAWITFFNLMMILFSALYFFYIKYKSKLDLITWERAYFLMMIGCALAWVPSIYLLPTDMVRQYLALLALFMATTGYATGTIGQLRLCIVTLNIMLIPLIIWCLIQGGLFYYIIAVYSIIYMGFMIGINHRSTQWLKDSLKLKLENTLVSYQANHDLLTNLPNQRLLPQFIWSAIENVRHTSDTFALACFSLNRLEKINDSYGHKIGNLIIQSVANRLKTFASQMEKIKAGPQCIVTITRTDTFNILIASLKVNEIENNVKQLFSVLKEPFYLEQKGVRLTASIGVSVYKIDADDASSLQINSDAAMLKAKQSGGNRIEFYRTEINAQDFKQVEMEHELNLALQNNELLLYYQPLINLRTGQLCGMEALIRWQHPKYGFIPPIKFIPIAEETGLILPIGEWVLMEACKQTMIWHEMGFASLKVAVNLSEKQLRQENIIDIVDNALLKSRLDPSFLELEITETAILDESVVPLLKEFKKMGLSLAVDDFGTGYSGLSYLKRFSIDKLKIDQSFIRDIPINNDSIAIVSAIIAMAKELKVSILAEGVETLEQVKYLKSKGCDFAQGYYFGKPLEASYFTKLLLNHESFAQSI